MKKKPKRKEKKLNGIDGVVWRNEKRYHKKKAEWKMFQLISLVVLWIQFSGVTKQVGDALLLEGQQRTGRVVSIGIGEYSDYLRSILSISKFEKKTESSFKIYKVLCESANFDKHYYQFLKPLKY